MTQLTDQGTKLAFGDAGDRDLRVDAEPADGAAADGDGACSEGTLADFKGFILDDAYKRNASLLLRRRDR